LGDDLSGVRDNDATAIDERYHRVRPLFHGPTIRIRKTTRPTITELPMTKLPKVAMTLPASASDRMRRVD